MAASDKEAFSPLNLSKISFNEIEENRYQVYSNGSEFVVVSAENASNAIEKSNIKNPSKVIHITNDLIYILDNTNSSVKNP